MLNERETSAVVAVIVDCYPDVQAVYLFGSHRTGYASSGSDVDIAVLLPHDAVKRAGDMRLSECRMRIESDLRQEVDLINLRSASTVFQFQVVTTGGTIHVADERAVDEFEMLTLSLYQKLNEERRGILTEFLRTGRAYGV